MEFRIFKSTVKDELGSLPPLNSITISNNGKNSTIPIDTINNILKQNDNLFDYKHLRNCSKFKFGMEIPKKDKLNRKRKSTDIL
jgi:hypothetical protein